MVSSFLRVCSSSFLCSICLKKYPVIIAEDNKLAILSFEEVILHRIDLKEAFQEDLEHYV